MPSSFHPACRGTCPLALLGSGAARSCSSISFPFCHRRFLLSSSAAAAVRCFHAASVVQIGAQNAMHASLSPAPQVSHTGSHSCLLNPAFCPPVLLATAPLRCPSAPDFLLKESCFRPASLPDRLSSPRHLPPFPAAGAAPMCHHRSISLRCGTCLRSAAAGAARSRLPLSGQSVIGTILRPRSAAAAVRCTGETTAPRFSSARRLLPCAACCRSHLLLVGAGNNSTPRSLPEVQLSAQIGAQNARHASLPAASSDLCPINPTFSPDFCYRFFISRRRLPADIQ